jgi:hypothetical protein
VRRGHGLRGALVLTPLALLLSAGACSPEYAGYDRLEAIEPATQADCEVDELRLRYEVDYAAGLDLHFLRSIELRDLGDSCRGAAVALTASGVDGVLGTGSATVTPDGRAQVLFDPIVERMGAGGETVRSSNLDIAADDVTAIDLVITATDTGAG